MITSILHASILIFGTMTIFFIASILKKDNSVVDIAWPIGFIQLTLYFFYNHPNPGALQYIACILIIAWGLRLMWHIIDRNEHIVEDPRYKQWRIDWYRKGTIYFFCRSFIQIFMMHGFFILIINLPVIAIQTDSIMTGIDIWNICGLIILLISFTLTAVTDAGSLRFKRTNTKANATILSSLWRYSKLGESLLWWGVWLLAIHTQYGFFTIISPITITILLLFTSNIAFTEKYLNSGYTATLHNNFFLLPIILYTTNTNR